MPDKTAAPPGSKLRTVPGSTFVLFAREEIDQSIARRFERIAAKYPTRIAVKANDRSFNFEVLNQMANRIARAILRQSAAQSEAVAVLVSNSMMTTAAILGVLKAGKIFVPLDSSHSPAWARFILDDTRAKLIICDNAAMLAAKPWLGESHTVIDIDSIDSRLSSENLGVDVFPGAIAHILYTSGSTGHPKGVMDNHRNTLHYVMRLTNASHISPEDRVTLVRPPSSSGALMNLYLVLLNGATLFPMEIKEAGLRALADWLRREKITIFHAGGTLFRHLARQLTEEERFPDLRLIRLSSGQIFRSDFDLFRRNFARSLLLHVLSSTEANTYRVHFLNKDSAVADGAVPVGYGVEDLEILILDECRNAVNTDALGEIAIRSAYLFPGYWNNQALTEAAFLPHADADGRRTYLTGDLGRLRADGCLEYLGRKDFRFKIRGHSIQAEEVEVALLKIPEIVQATAATFKDGQGDDRLVAYIVPRQTSVPNVSDLRRLLGDLLPQYMIPTRFMVLKSLPLMPNGKVNRQELPLPPRVRPELSSPYSKPLTSVESAVAKLWSDALSIDVVGRDDNFFDLGGDSLVASKIVSTLNRIFPCSLSITEFFASPTVAENCQSLIGKEAFPGQTEIVSDAYLKIEAMSSEEIHRVVESEREMRQPAKQQPIKED
jgi:amino acid adenylation domain-containing protein